MPGRILIPIETLDQAWIAIEVPHLPHSRRVALYNLICEQGTAADASRALEYYTVKKSPRLKARFREKLIANASTRAEFKHALKLEPTGEARQRIITAIVTGNDDDANDIARETCLTLSPGELEQIVRRALEVSPGLHRIRRVNGILRENRSRLSDSLRAYLIGEVVAAVETGEALAMLRDPTYFPPEAPLTAEERHQLIVMIRENMTHALTPAGRREFGLLSARYTA